METKSNIMKKFAISKARKEGKILIENYSELSRKQQNTIMANKDLFFILIDIKLGRTPSTIKGIPNLD